MQPNKVGRHLDQVNIVLFFGEGFFLFLFFVLSFLFLLYLDIFDYVKKPKRKTLINKLDRIFSEYIRKRDSDKKGFVKCITSGKKYHYTEVDAGHFISRKEMSTRWNEDNVYAQSRYDNRYRYGRQYEYSLALEKKKKGLPKHLYNLSKETVKYSIADLQELIDKYKKKLDIENKRLSL